MAKYFDSSVEFCTSFFFVLSQVFSRMEGKKFIRKLMIVNLKHLSFGFEYFDKLEKKKIDFERHNKKVKLFSQFYTKQINFSLKKTN